ncbi:hypothetical protein CR513_07632, partial [Mucuna pruriens]
MTNPNKKDWIRLLEDALWAYRTAYRTPLGCLPTGLSLCNLDYDQAGKQRQFQLQELDELRLEAYENSRIYKQKILRKEFRVGQKVLLFNSRLKLIVGKLRSRWDEPFVITNVLPYGAIELKDKHTNNTFQVNGHQIKLFHEGPTPTAGDLETISLMEPTPNEIVAADNQRFEGYIDGCGMCGSIGHSFNDCPILQEPPPPFRPQSVQESSLEDLMKQLTMNNIQFKKNVSATQ